MVKQKSPQNSSAPSIAVISNPEFRLTDLSSIRLLAEKGNPSKAFALQVVLWTRPGRQLDMPLFFQSKKIASGVFLVFAVRLQLIQRNKPLACQCYEQWLCQRLVQRKQAICSAKKLRLNRFRETEGLMMPVHIHIFTSTQPQNVVAESLGT